MKNTEFDALDGEERKAAKAPLDHTGRSVRCWVWAVDCDHLEGEDPAEANEGNGEMVVKLPDLAEYELPELASHGVEKDKEERTKIVKIAGLDCQLVALTNKGHVVRFRGLDREAAVTSAGRATKWEYVSVDLLAFFMPSVTEGCIRVDPRLIRTQLPYFSEVEKVREDPVWTDEKNGLKPPEAMHITHVSDPGFSFSSRCHFQCDHMCSFFFKKDIGTL